MSNPAMTFSCMVIKRNGQFLSEAVGGNTEWGPIGPRVHLYEANKDSEEISTAVRNQEGSVATPVSVSYSF